MGSKRNLSVGITVNLDNYENLRLEVSGEVSGEEEAEELIQFLDGILGRFGRGSEETAAKIESYRKRVIRSPGPPVVIPKTPEMGVSPTPEAEAKPVVSGEAPSMPPPVIEKEPIMVAKEPVFPTRPRTLPDPETSQAAVKKSVDESAAVPSEFRCERCGVPITPVQRKLSRLFQDKDLCRSCLNRP
ncbi:MAG: hypothetical protein QHG99_04045 [Methanomicrobiales archaeon]|nr:hypothetical protein [Methanomicrobiales archaeon]